MWTRLDDNFPDHPKVVGLSDRAFRVHVTGLCYASRHLTDGFVPRAAAKSWGRAVAELVEARLWVAEDNGYRIHAFLEYNPAREKVLADRMRTGQQRSLAGKARATTAERDSTGRFQRDAQRPAGEPLVNGSQPRPDPTRPAVSVRDSGGNGLALALTDLLSPDGDDSSGVPKNISHDQAYLLPKIHDLGPGWKKLTWGSVGQFNATFGRSTTTNALRTVADSTTDVANGHAYLEAICKQLAEEATA